MKTCEASAPNAVRRSRSGLNWPGRDWSACDRSQTKNSVLPGLYSQRMTMFPRRDLVLKSGIVGEGGRVELERQRTGQLPDVVVVADGDEWLQVGLQRQIAAEGVGASHGDVDDIAVERAVDVVGRSVAIAVNVGNPLRQVVPEVVIGGEARLHPIRQLQREAGAHL